jgi:hypothetical protein
MRLDNVLLRIRDTRIYVEFGTGEVIREYVAKEEQYEVVRQVRSRAFFTRCSMEPLAKLLRNWHHEDKTYQHSSETQTI